MERLLLFNKNIPTKEKGRRLQKEIHFLSQAYLTLHKLHMFYPLALDTPNNNERERKRVESILLQKNIITFITVSIFKMMRGMMPFTQSLKECN